MKKIWIMPILLLGFLLTGCSVDLDLFPSDTESKAEKFASKAEAMGNQFDDTSAFLEELEIKEKLSVQDQERIVTEADALLAVIEEFANEDAPVFQGAKDFAVDKLKEREEILLDIQEKAKSGEATMDDVKDMKNALSDDIEIKLFGK
jgi:hypothetical protein